MSRQLNFANDISLDHLKVSCTTCSLRELCLPIGLNDTDLVKLDTIVNRRQQITLGHHLYRASDNFSILYAVRSGFIKTYDVNTNGHEQVNGFHMAGELLGFDGISTDIHLCNAVALEDSEVCAIPFAKLEGLAREIPALQRQLHRLLSKEIALDQTLMMLLGAVNAEGRLAAFLFNLSVRREARGLSSTKIHLLMSREEIGNYLSLKLETVSRAFSKLQKAGLITVERRNVIIKNRDGLRCLTE